MQFKVGDVILHKNSYGEWSIALVIESTDEEWLIQNEAWILLNNFGCALFRRVWEG